MEYTKGEWKAEQGNNGDFRIIAGKFRPTVICHTRQDISRLNYDEMKANAQLIAAAPRMHKALKHAQTVLYNLKVANLGELTQQQHLLVIEVVEVLAEVEGK